MQYMILIYADEKVFATFSEEDQQKGFELFMTYTKELAEAGVLRSGDALKPTDTATTLRVKNGKLTTTDGPFAESKEQLGGYYIIDTATLDEALKWAGKCPGVEWGSVEVRPMAGMSAVPG